jgi:hypothetical protein
LSDSKCASMLSSHAMRDEEVEDLAGLESLVLHKMLAQRRVSKSNHRSRGSVVPTLERPGPHSRLPRIGVMIGVGLL